MQTNAYDAMTDQLINNLERQLTNIFSKSMSWDEIDGFFTAIHSSPYRVPMDEVLSEVFGEHFTSDKVDADYMPILAPIFELWNNIGDRLSTDDIFLPCLTGSDEACHRWALGFFQGTNYFNDEWHAFLDRDDAGAVVPLFAFKHEFDKDISLRPYKEKPISHEQRNKLLQYLSVAVTQIYQHFEPQRKLNALKEQKSQVISRDEPKIGRNDPCYCGSGKKYKKCCLNSG